MFPSTGTSQPASYTERDQTEGEQRPVPLAREALEAFGEYQRTGDQPSLVRAVRVFRAALAGAVRVGVPDIADDDLFFPDEE